jgi:hypothetical protein
MMESKMEINDVLSGVVDGIGPQKYCVVIDAQTRSIAESPEARNAAMRHAAAHGFGQGGLCESPSITIIGMDGNDVPEAEVLTPGLQIAGYRATFLFANKY